MKIIDNMYYTDTHVYFWRNKTPFSNFYRRPFTYKGYALQFSEQGLMNIIMNISISIPLSIPHGRPSELFLIDFAHASFSRLKHVYLLRLIRRPRYGRKAMPLR